MQKVFISVDKDKIAAGDPNPIRVEEGGDVRWVAQVEFTGTMRLFYLPRSPRPDGSRVWLELDSSLHLWSNAREVKGS